MHYPVRQFALLISLLLMKGTIMAQQLHFTVSMEQPASHYFHVELRCSAIKDTATDFKMPVWTPGYYQRMDYAKNVEHLR